MLLLDSSDNFGEFSSDDRAQLLFRLFAHLVVGGPLNQVSSQVSHCLILSALCHESTANSIQFDDFIAPYFDLTKTLYKDLVT